MSLRRESINDHETIQDHLKKIRRELNNAMQRRGRPSESFVPRDSIKRIWTDDRLTEFARYGVFLMDDVQTVSTDYLQTLSILADIHWDQWEDFREIFLEHPCRTDKDIPYELPLLEGDIFLGYDWAQKFFCQQYIFCPVDIEEGDNEFSEGSRLPFLDDFEFKGKGASGFVTKEHIAHDSRLFPEKKYFACKHFFDQGAFFRERENLMRLKDSLTHHDHIMTSFATIKIGREFKILMDIADMNLEEFMRQSVSFPLKDLIRQGRNLASALHVLHQELDPELIFYHSDLKPANILVFKEGSDDSGVGQWKISDFGTSIYDIPTENSALNTFRFSQREQGSWTYQSPEVANGNNPTRRSDVWSLGCILVRVLAFGLGGRTELKDLDDRRGKQQDGSTPYWDDCFHRDNPPVRNPHIERWLNELPGKTNPQWLSEERTSLFGDLSKVLLGALEVDVDRRLRAREVKIELDKIHKRLEDLPSQPSSSRPTDSDSSRISQQSTPPTPTTPEQSEVISSGTLVQVLVDNNTDDRKKVEELGVLLRKGADVEGSEPTKRPLIHAIDRGFDKAVDMLLLYHPHLDIESPDSNGSTPLCLALEKGNRAIVGRLLDAGVNVDAPSKDSQTPLWLAIEKGERKIVNRLLEARVNVDAPSKDAERPFGLAITKGNGEIIDRLLEAGVNVDAPSKQGMTPLMLAARHGRCKVVRSLLSRRANCLALSEFGFTCLHYALWATTGGSELIRLLKNQVPVPFDVEGMSESPLVTLIKNYAPGNNWREMFHALTKGLSAANLNLKDRDGKSAMYYAVLNNRVKVATALHEQGARFGDDQDYEQLERDRWRPSSSMKALFKKKGIPLKSPSRGNGFLSRYLSHG